ncbi:helix-turn-helix domain-containing protein [Nocardia flavorosea]|uniref:PucR family transcriptional regulator n=1 Tax=Nocardia flavorosea TaxID=53429 RepID=UPI001894A194|nr:helix-turn-helix domain-containing protein [Nocardia flavorosea]MBF6350164.1 helix-turn-helix domain-containing protein [Nocardia flavorosea]
MGSATATTIEDSGVGIVPTTPLHWLVHWLGNEHDELLDALVESAISAVPELAVARDEPLTQVRSAIQVHLQALTECAGESRQDGRMAVPTFVDRYTRAIARHEMLRLPVLLRAFEEIHATLWRRLVAAMRDGRYELPPVQRADVLEHVSAHLFSYFRIASSVTATAYTTERALLARRSSTHRTEVVTGLLAGTVSQADAERELGYEMNSTHIGYVAWVEQLSELDRLEGVLTTLTERLRPRRHLWVPTGENSVFGWISSRDDNWCRLVRETALPPGTRCAWGSLHAGMGGFRATHLDALEARRVGEATGSAGEGTPVLYDDVAVAALASRDVAAASMFVRRQLGRLADGSEATVRLLQTLRIYLDELASPTRTARRLHVHPNTVVKRLERIETLLGRRVDPASLPLRVAVELAPLVTDSTRAG